MSCGKPHETPCTEVLALVYSYLDQKLDPPDLEPLDCTKIQQHLDECGPCLREYGLEKVVKELVHKYCGYDAVPKELRAKVMARIQEVRVELELIEVRPE
jgi:mycothiol system anti-sigma-R factor